MTANHLSPRGPRARSLALAPALAGLLALAGGPLAAEPGNNRLVLGAGTTSIDGSRDTFKARNDRPDGFVGGLEDLHFEHALDDGAMMTIDARVIPDLEDYAFTLDVTKPEVGGFTFGYETFRRWSEGVTVAVPGVALWLEPFDPELVLDKGKWWIEARLDTPNLPKILARYTRSTREGAKASTSWGDNITGGVTRNIVPSFRALDEIRDEFLLEISHKLGEKTDVKGGLRWQETRTENALQIRRRPGETGGVDRYLTANEGFNNDLFAIHGSAVHQVNDQLKLSSGAIWTTLSGTSTADRIYGDRYDAAFDPLFANRQQRDHGTIDLTGTSELKQLVANFNAAWTPSPKLTIVPSIRLERTYQDVMADYTDTEVARVGTALVTELHESASESNRDYDLLSAALDVRYTGIKDWTLYADALLSRGEGTLEEQVFDTHDPANPVLGIDRLNDDTRVTAKVGVGANWRINRALRLTLGADYKESTNEYGIVRDSTSNAITAGDRYPSYIQEQSFAKTSVNARLNWKVAQGINSISRVDYQLGTIDSQTFFILGLESKDYERLVISQAVSLQPIQRLTISGNVSLVSDLLRTPANTAPGQPRHNLVTVADQGYLFGTLTAMYAATDATDVQLVLTGIRYDNFVNTSPVSPPYGADLDERTVSATLNHRFSENVAVSLAYAFQRYRSLATGGYTDYDAHLIGTKLQYRF